MTAQRAMSAEKSHFLRARKALDKFRDLVGNTVGMDGKSHEDQAEYFCRINFGKSLESFITIERLENRFRDLFGVARCTKIGN
jgi:hypothetical protein